MLCWLRLRTLCTFVIRILTIVTDLQAENRLSPPCGAGRGPHFNQTSQPYARMLQIIKSTLKLI